MTIQKPITLQEAKSIARHLGLTLRKVRSGHYRVNFRDRVKRAFSEDICSENNINPFGIDYGTPVAEKPDF